MPTLADLNPPLLWQWFNQISAIPRPSYHEEKVAKFIVDWAKSQNLETKQDKAGNILIRKAASPGYEHHIPVALQAHLDMVGQKTPESPHNFMTDPIEPYVDGDWVKAKDTTLGADNGIGLASTLAVLASNDLSHPPLEVLLTTSEETGMEGALGLEPGWLKSAWMINTDSERDGEICIGCAGGINANLELHPRYSQNTDSAALMIIIEGGKGGHSGIDIDRGRLNTLQFTARILAELARFIPFRLEEFHSGSAHNAIPRGAKVSLSLPADKIAAATAKIKEIFTSLKEKIAPQESKLTLEVKETTPRAEALEPAYQEQLLALLTSLPNGVQTRSAKVAGAPESSLNLSVLELSPEKGELLSLIRALNEPAKKAIEEKLQTTAKRLGFAFTFSHDYPGWEPEESGLLQLAEKEFKEVNGKDATLSVIHAGLECGLIKAKYPKLQIISMGPTIEGAHSPEEKVNISTVEKYWQILTGLLANIPAL